MSLNTTLSVSSMIKASGGLRAVDSGSTFTIMSFLIGPVSGALVAGGVRRPFMSYAVILE